MKVFYMGQMREERPYTEYSVEQAAKWAFVGTYLEQALVNMDAGIYGVSYHQPIIGEGYDEVVVIDYGDGCTKVINVSGDSKQGIVYDIARKAL